ncbi:hypothetical protein MHYP_G00019760 [Metynnis hypsauchen]
MWEIPCAIFVRGKRSAAEYALEFRTLAAGSGWSEVALLTVYKRGLRRDLQAEMVCRGEQMTLDHFIQISFALDGLVRERSYLQRPSITTPVTPALTPEAEPMELGRTCLPETERRRRLRENLCLYCGRTGHRLANCSQHPSSSRTLEVSTLFPNFESIGKMTVGVAISSGSEMYFVTALMDSGAAGNFIDADLVQRWKVPVEVINPPLDLRAVDDRPLVKGQVTEKTSLLTMRVGLVHEENINFYVICSPKDPIILGYPWLVQHDPSIIWSKESTASGCVQVDSATLCG